MFIPLLFLQLIYPIEAHWIMGRRLVSTDWDSTILQVPTAIHMVGGICALIGAAMLGPRIGKFTKDKSGKITKVNAFPGHNLPIGCLGVFILWLGWYGFNGAAATSVEAAWFRFRNNYHCSGSCNCCML